MAGRGSGDGRGAVLSRRLFVRRAVRTTAGVWLAPLAACGGGADDGGTAERDASAGDAEVPRDAATADAGNVQDDAGAQQRDAGGAARDAGEAGDGGWLNDDACEPFLTPLSTFFVQDGGEGTIQDWREPELDPGAHRVVIDGEVTTPLSLSLADLEAMTPQLTVLKTMECVVRLHGTALYGGVPLRPLLDAAGIDRDVTRRIRFHGHDGFRNNLRLEDVYPSGDASGERRFEPMLALRIDGRPLPRALGAPVRLLLPDRFGFKNIKWLARIEATQSDDPVGDYQELGLASDEGRIIPNTWYTGQYSHAAPAGAITLCGHAVSGFAGIDAVEVSVDDGEYRAARILPLDQLRAAEPRLQQALQVAEGWDYPFVGVKAPWELELEVSPGQHALTLRVTDLAGEVTDGFRAVLTFEA